jgi:Gluconate 2-dehydrogenase subunit 3
VTRLATQHAMHAAGRLQKHLYTAVQMVISDQHLRMLKALANCVVPPDDAPGAGDSGNLDYVSDVLTGDYSGQLEAVRTFLDRLNASSHAAHRRAFVDLDGRAQAALLDAVESDGVFHMLVTLIQEGYWGSAAGLAAIGFEVSL